MNMTKQQILDFISRIDNLTSVKKLKFGKMDVNHMVCHCTDFFRMAKRTKNQRNME